MKKTDKITEARKVLNVMKKCVSEVHQSFDFGGITFRGVDNPGKYVDGLKEYIKKYGGSQANGVEVSASGTYEITIMKPRYNVADNDKIVDAVDMFITDKTNWKFDNSKF